MKRIVLLIVGIVASLSTFAAAGINLSDALDKKLVRMDAVTTAGSYTGKVLRLTITNNGKTAIVVNVNTGMVLRPTDQTYQQLVLPGGETLALKPRESSQVDVQIFCFNAVKACPVEGLHYTYYRMCGDVMMKVLVYVKIHALYDHLGQSAVWAISNYLGLYCVYDRSKHEESEKLIAHIVAVTKRPKPAYYTTYADNKVPGARAYLGRAETIYVPFDMNLSVAKTVTFAVYTDRGVFVKKASDPQWVQTGKRTIIAELTPTDFETGKYLVRVMQGEQILQECPVLIEQPWITFKD